MLRPLLRLARIPNVFTAFANVVAGVALVRGGGFAPRDLALVFGSGALYTAGMVLNDYFDRKVDALERPSRPIPAGEVTPWAAASLGVGLLGVGLAMAAWHSAIAFAMALGLALAIVSYDAWAKNTVLGPLFMGSCRALNTALGMSVTSWQTPWLALLPLCSGTFTLLITRLSRHEVSGTVSDELRGTVLALGALGVLIAPALVCLAFVTGAGAPYAVCALIPYSFVVYRGLRLFGPILRDATPRTIGPAIGGGILLMPAIDAAFVAAAGAPGMALVVFALAGPAYLLKRWYYMT